MLTTVKQDYQIEGAARIVRKWMVDHYGSGVSLAGHCIEASELLCGILHLFGVDAESVEGWVQYDNTKYCEYPYDAHTWVEVVIDNIMYYVDVTADQFNYGMDPEYKFADIVIQQGYPHGVTQVLPGRE